YTAGTSPTLPKADGYDALGQLRSDDPALRIEEVAGDFGTSPLTPVPVAFPLAERVVDRGESWSPGADGDDRLGDPVELADRFDDARLLAQHAGCGAVRQEQWGVDGVCDAAGDKSGPAHGLHGVGVDGPLRGDPAQLHDCTAGQRGELGAHRLDLGSPDESEDVAFGDDLGEQARRDRAEAVRDRGQALAARA